MGINRLRYGKQLEKEANKKGIGLEEMQKKASIKADKYDKPSWLDKAILKRLKARKKKQLKAKFKTTRTKHVEGGLKAAGLSDADIRRLQGGK